MNKPFDMALFLSGVLKGSKGTQQRHLWQARIIQAAIQQRWRRDNPWIWKLKHVQWLFTQHLKDHSDDTRYYYLLTTLLIWNRLGKDPNMLAACSTIHIGSAALKPRRSRFEIIIELKFNRCHSRD